MELYCSVINIWSDVLFCGFIWLFEARSHSLYTWYKSDFILSPNLAHLWVDREISITACWLFGKLPKVTRAVQRATQCVTKSKPRFQSQFAFHFRNTLDPKERSKIKLEFPFVQLGLSAVWRWTFSSFIREPEPRGPHQHPLPWLLHPWNRELSSNLSVVPVDHTKPAPGGSSQTELGRLVCYPICDVQESTRGNNTVTLKRKGYGTPIQAQMDHPVYEHTGQNNWEQGARGRGSWHPPKAYALEACSPAQAIIGRWWHL